MHEMTHQVTANSQAIQAMVPFGRDPAADAMARPTNQDAELTVRDIVLPCTVIVQVCELGLRDASIVAIVVLRFDVSHIIVWLVVVDY